MKDFVLGVLLVVFLVGGSTFLVAATSGGVPPTTTTTTIDAEYARCFAIVTHQEVLKYRDLETARYLADVACNDGKVRIP